MKTFAIVYKNLGTTHIFIKRSQRKLRHESCIKVIREALLQDIAVVRESDPYTVVELDETRPDVLIDYAKIANSINAGMGNNITTRYIE